MIVKLLIFNVETGLTKYVRNIVQLKINLHTLLIFLFLGQLRKIREINCIIILK